MFANYTVDVFCCWQFSTTWGTYKRNHVIHLVFQ